MQETAEKLERRRSKVLRTRHRVSGFPEGRRMVAVIWEWRARRIIIAEVLQYQSFVDWRTLADGISLLSSEWRFFDWANGDDIKILPIYA